MGQEIEYKLRAETNDQLSKAYKRVRQCALESNERRLQMLTRYYDTEPRYLQPRKWTLRVRQEDELPKYLGGYKHENAKQILTFKTPGKNYCRGEWNLERPLDAPEPTEQCVSLAEGIPPQPEELAALVADGAPKELMYLSDFHAVCGAIFYRVCSMLTLNDGTKIELAADYGKLFGQTETLDFYELELELYGGNENRLSELAKIAGLPEEHLSKAARAFRLR